MWADAALAVIAGDKDESVRLAAAHILAKLTPNGLFPPEALEPIVQASLRRYSSPSAAFTYAISNLAHDLSSSKAWRFQQVCTGSV